MMKSLRLLLLALTILPLGGSPTLEQAAEHAVAELPETWMVTGISKDGAKRFSLHGEPCDLKAQDVIFEIGSISKVFTGLLLAIAVEEGKVRYDSTLADLTDLDFEDPKIGTITLLQLATHTSGLPRLPNNHPFDASKDPYANYDRNKLNAYLSTTRLDGSAPHDAAYSNLGYGLLGDLLARSWETDWGKLVEQKIAHPLGLKDTVQTPSKTQEARLAPPRDGNTTGHRWHFTALAGAGALHSTADDMLRFGEAFIHPESTPLEKALRKVITIHSEAHGLGGPSGLGIMIRKLQTQTEFSHSGGTGGYRSHLQILPEQSLVQVILANNTAAVPTGVISTTQPSPTARAMDFITLTPEHLDRFCGIYHIDPQSRFTVLRHDQLLMAQLTGQPFIPLDALAENRFRYRRVDAELLFEPKDGAVTQLVLFQNGRELPAKRGNERAPAIQFPNAKLLEAYAGSYKLAPGKTIKVTVRANTLYAQLSDQPAFPVFQTKDDRFIYFVVDAAIAFERDSNDQVTGLTLHQNGEHRAVRE